MFNVGPWELLMLSIVAVLVIGPDRLPQLSRDAARLIKTLRDMATGAREQLREELGPEFADIDFRSLNPRVAVQRVLLGEDLQLDALNPRRLLSGTGASLRDDLRDVDPRSVVRETFADIPVSGAPAERVTMRKTVVAETVTVLDDTPRRPRPRPRPAQSSVPSPDDGYGSDIT